MVKPTKVIFLVPKKGGAVFAIFPELPGDTPTSCRRFDFDGGESQAPLPDTILDSRTARRAEYARYLPRLLLAGYGTLEVVRRITAPMKIARWQRAAALEENDD